MREKGLCSIRGVKGYHSTCPLLSRSSTTVDYTENRVTFTSWESLFRTWRSSFRQSSNWFTGHYVSRRFRLPGECVVVVGVPHGFSCLTCWLWPTDLSPSTIRCCIARRWRLVSRAASSFSVPFYSSFSSNWSSIPLRCEVWLAHVKIQLILTPYQVIRVILYYVEDRWKTIICNTNSPLNEPDWFNRVQHGIKAKVLSISIIGG